MLVYQKRQINYDNYNKLRHAYNISKLPTIDVDQIQIQNDGISPNPKGRDIIDNKYMRAKNKLL